MHTDEFKELMNRGYIPRYELTDMKLEDFPDGDIYKILDDIYCLGGACKTISQELDCLRVICKISLLLGEMKSPYFLTDVHISNCGFKYSIPMYIDIGSFSTVKVDRMQYIQGMLDKFDIKFKNDWNLLLEDINKVKVKLDKGEWGNYSNAAYLEYESTIALNWLNTDKDIKTIIDVGCCAGEFAKLFSEKGYNVIAIDNNEYVLNKLYNESKGMNIFCLLLNVAKNYEINDDPANKCLMEWVDKIKGDVVFCSSIMHHLYLNGLNFENQVKLWDKICSKYIIIEYIDNNDVFVKEWKCVKKDYTMNAFLNSFEKNWEFIDTKPSEYDNRYWYFFKKK